METILYQAGSEQGPQNRLPRYLALGWGRICRAGLSSPFRKLKEAICCPSSLSLKRFRPLLLPLGNGLIILSLAGLLLTFYPLIRAEIGFRANRLVSTNPTVSRGYFADLLIQVEVPVAIQAPDPNFSLFIPKIGASSPVMANIDPGNQQKYDQALKIGVAHAAGTGFPGMGETIYLFAHSTDAPWNIIRYNAVFYLLRELELEDQVIVFFSGKRFNYRVFDKKIVSASETGFFSNQGEEILILQTCWPPGTTLRRLLVFARPVG